MTPPSSSFDSLRKLLSEVAALGSIQSLVSWDQETKMPDAGAGARAEQLALLAGLVHERRVSSELADALAACEEDEALAEDPAVAADLRELRRELDRERRLPRELVESLARAQSRGQEAWKAARAASDFSTFQPTLEELLEMIGVAIFLVALVQYLESLRGSVELHFTPSGHGGVAGDGE